MVGHSLAALSGVAAQPLREDLRPALHSVKATIAPPQAHAQHESTARVIDEAGLRIRMAAHQTRDTATRSMDMCLLQQATARTGRDRRSRHPDRHRALAQAPPIDPERCMQALQLTHLELCTTGFNAPT